LITALLAGTALAQSAPPVDLSKWSPEYVKSIAGTENYDAATQCGKVVPNDHKGRVSYWYQGPTEAEPQITHDMDKAFWDAFKAAYPNIQVEAQSIHYNEMLDKFRTALLGNAAPMVIRLQILGGVGFAAKGYLQPLSPEEVGYTTADFWPGALKSVTWQGADLRRPDQQRDDGLYLERQDLRGCWA
jgi:multiple sugar transport system substrate-binding protein